MRLLVILATAALTLSAQTADDLKGAVKAQVQPKVEATKAAAAKQGEAVKTKGKAKVDQAKAEARLDKAKAQAKVDQARADAKVERAKADAKVDKAKSEARLDKLKAEAKVGKDGEELAKTTAKGKAKVDKTKATLDKTKASLDKAVK